ncbi:hypothetical protein JRO89_XS03G0209200 [Xanthoceras sorbifolium]|uniref:DYW domain-containing protein n=1 Tax=Xanthoceras sorbifolium TaxID=99658 RepID=A0ABQ8IAX1_9ROSI|nr:hypothetical protein JRO89_XS03G0209200 [Xanthoceras sorbifolium]
MRAKLSNITVNKTEQTGEKEERKEERERRERKERRRRRKGRIKEKEKKEKAFSWETWNTGWICALGGKSKWVADENWGSVARESLERGHLKGCVVVGVVPSLCQGKPVTSFNINSLYTCVTSICLKHKGLGKVCHPYLMDCCQVLGVFGFGAELGLYGKDSLGGFNVKLFRILPQQNLLYWTIQYLEKVIEVVPKNTLTKFFQPSGCGLDVNRFSFPPLLKAAARIEGLFEGMQVHGLGAKLGFDSDPFVQTSLVGMYAAAGRIKDARLIFDQMVEKDLVSWSAMISGYAESDQPQEALKLFNEMQVLNMKPDQVTMLSVISACAHLGALDQAQWIHLYVDKYGLGGDLRVNNAIIDMYAKCGNLERAREVFEKMQRRNVISWTSMINAFAAHGDASNALAFFHKMKEENIEPNGVTFVGLLYACSHAGLVEEGRKIFSSMINEHNIAPKHEHYGCMVDLFGRASLLREALEVVETMPLAPNVVIWGSLMAACWVHGEIELGEFAAKQLLRLEPDHDGALVVLSNIYAKERRWQDVGELRNLMKQRGVSKERGSSRVEINNEVHEFLMADRNHKLADQIYEKLNEVVTELKRVGYVPNTHCVLVDLDEDKKREVVLWHSEKLALCYGLMSEPNGSCIRIVKNLRVCEDCHNFIKLVSKVYEREIIVRDRTRFHHYKDGICSCKDYW